MRELEGIRAEGDRPLAIETSGDVEQCNCFLCRRLGSSPPPKLLGFATLRRPLRRAARRVLGLPRHASIASPRVR